MATPTNVTESVELKAAGLGGFLEVGSAFLTSLTGRLTACLAAVTLLLTTSGKLAETAKPYLPDKTPVWVLPSVLRGLIGLFLMIGCYEGIAAFVAQRRKRKRAELSSGALKAGYFQLGPRQADSEFDRADNKHLEILTWLQQTQEPVAYLTGKSGSGKSSLLDAWVIPKLQGSESAPVVLRLRGYQDPVQTLERELQRQDLAYESSSTEPAYVSTLLRLASRKLGPRRLYVVFDQFEEFVILRNEEQRANFAALLASLAEQPVAGLTLLFVLRSDYLGLLDNLALPKLLQDINWKHVPPFTESAAQKFLQQSGMRIDEEVLEAVLQEAAEIEQTRGLIRPITVNLCGLVLGRFAGGLPRGFRPGAMIRGFLRESVSLREIREISPRIVPRMITPQLTKYPRSVAALAKDTGLAEADVRICLWTLGQRERGIVRPLDKEQENWEISHDFLVPLLDSVFARWTVSLWRRMRLWLPWAATATLAVAVLVAYSWRRDPGAELLDLGWKVNITDGAWDISVDGRTPKGSVRILKRIKLPLHASLNLLDSSFSEWASLKNLTALDLRGELVSDLSPLKGLKNLTTLELGNTNVSDLSPLKDVKNLTALDLSGGLASDLSPLKNLKNLTTLNLFLTNVSDLSPLKDLKNLTALRVTSMKVIDVSPLKDLKNLTTLSVESVSDVSPLKDLKNLTTLRVAGSVSDVSPLKDLENLTTLDLSYTEVGDVSPLKDLKNLTTLDLRNTKVSDVSPLRNLKNLTIVR